MRRIFTGFLITLALVSSSCTRGQRLQKKVVVEINGQQLNAEEFARLLARKLRNFDALSAKDEKNLSFMKDQVLNEFAVSSVIKEWALQNNIKLSDDELKQEIDRIRKDYPDDLTFHKAIVNENLTFDEWKAAFRNDILKKRVVSQLTASVQEPPAAEMESYYKAHIDQFQVKERAKFAQIVVASEDDAKNIHQAIQKGGNFADMAKKYSQGSENNKDGEIGWIDLGTSDIFDQVFNLGKGNISPPKKSAFGYHIIKMLDKQSAKRLTFAEVKERVRLNLMREREQAIFDTWLTGQLKTAKFKVDKDLLAAIKVETRL